MFAIWVRRLLARLAERRRCPRVPAEGLVAYYWTGSMPKPNAVRDIGFYGARIAAPDVFYPRTLVQIVLEDRSRRSEDGSHLHICVCGQVNRKTSDGFCVAFLFSDAHERMQLRRFLKGLKSKEEVRADGVKAEPAEAAGEAEKTGASGEGEPVRNMEMDPEARDMTRKNRSSSGQSLLEFALILPLMLLLIFNVINFGGMLYSWIVVSNAARTGAQYACTGGATVGAPVPPSASAVQTVVLNDIHALPNSATAQVCISSSNSTTVNCNTGSAPSGTPPAVDTAEGTPGVTFIISAVDVTYTYQPFIRFWDFSSLGIHLTLPPTKIHRQAKMRLLQ